MAFDGTTYDPRHTAGGVAAAHAAVNDLGITKTEVALGAAEELSRTGYLNGLSEADKVAALNAAAEHLADMKDRLQEQGHSPAEVNFHLKHYANTQMTPPINNNMADTLLIMQASGKKADGTYVLDPWKAEAERVRLIQEINKATAQLPAEGPGRALSKEQYEELINKGVPQEFLDRKLAEQKVEKPKSEMASIPEPAARLINTGATLALATEAAAPTYSGGGWT